MSSDPLLKLVLKYSVAEPKLFVSAPFFIKFRLRHQIHLVTVNLTVFLLINHLHFDKFLNLAINIFSYSVLFGMKKFAHLKAIIIKNKNSEN